MWPPYTAVGEDLLNAWGSVLKNVLLAALLTAFGVMGSVLNVSAQQVHRSGQNIQPVYEGFEQNDDGSYTMWFGYLNRNYDETPSISVGNNNFFMVTGGGSGRTGSVSAARQEVERGEIDRGQPTFFYPRRQQFVFSVRVPEDFVGNALVWTISHRGGTNTAVGRLEPALAWTVDEGVWQANRGSRGLSGRTGLDNIPPEIRVVGTSEVSAMVGDSVTLRVFASDDGRPGPREATPASTGGRNLSGGIANNLPLTGGRGANNPTTQAVVRATNADETGLAVMWTLFRGGANPLEFSPAWTSVRTEGGEAVTSVSFGEPGRYVIRAYADDGTYTQSVDISVIVER